MISRANDLALLAFRNAASRVPAYRTLLQEAGIGLGTIDSFSDFSRLPLLDKRNTFQRFAVEELCTDGVLGTPATVLTSSGHSGIFAFGITDAESREATVKWVDDSLDLLFAVRSRRSLLINCLPMGVKVPTHACTLAETSVRPDMVVGLVKALGRHYTQLILVGEAAFLKLVLETGQRSGVKWRDHVVHIILGEEPLAENARKYLGSILSHDLHHPDKGIIFSSMGVAELGLNLFFEAPPMAPLILLRRLLHEDAWLRNALTTLDLGVRIPLIRYAPGDCGRFIKIPSGLRSSLAAQGITCESLDSIPIVAITGRGDFAGASDGAVFPEAVKEGLYHNASLAERTTANFRLNSAAAAVRIRIQLSPGVAPTSELTHEFHAAIANYIDAPYSVVCEAYEDFRSGMSLDYERKFPYIER
jgi:phenylacetate-CoA ligase